MLCFLFLGSNFTTIIVSIINTLPLCSYVPRGGHLGRPQAVRPVTSCRAKFAHGEDCSVNVLSSCASSQRGRGSQSGMGVSSAFCLYIFWGFTLLDLSPRFCCALSAPRDLGWHMFGSGSWVENMVFLPWSSGGKRLPGAIYICQFYVLSLLSSLSAFAPFPLAEERFLQ